jgi:hypothetical protein
MKTKRELIDVMNDAIEFALSNLHTATIAKVTGVQSKTISVQPVINRVYQGRSIALTEFVEVPPVFMQGGGSHTAYPIAVGDYCLLILTERCFDRWYGGADFQSPAEFRMHDYSDGLAIVGVNPLASAITIPSVIQQTGDTNQDGDYTRQGSLVQQGDMEITGDFILNGDMQVNGNIICSGTISAGNFSGLGGGDMTSTSDIVSQGISLTTHTHSGVDTGPGNTGGPQ